MNRTGNTTIKIVLPYCLYNIDTRFFELNDKFNTKIRFTKIETTPNKRSRLLENIETIRDRWGIDAYSEVEIETNKKFSQNESTKEAEVFSLDLINEFIKRYRYYAPNSVHLIPLIKEDLFEFNLKIGNMIHTTVNLAGGMKQVNPISTNQVSQQIELSLNKNEVIPLWDQLILNACQYLYQTEYRHSILESIMALELVLSNFIRESLKQKGVSTEFIKNIGIKGNINFILKLLVNTESLEKEIFEKCNASIKIRNNIVHKGANAKENDAKDALLCSEKLIHFLLSLKEISK